MSVAISQCIALALGPLLKYMYNALALACARGKIRMRIYWRAEIRQKPIEVVGVHRISNLRWDLASPNAKLKKFAS